MRVQVCEELHDWDSKIFRLRELDGSLVISWAPGLENPDPEGALDRGGFAERKDAIAFALGVDRWRSSVGLVPETIEEIDAERQELDDYRTGKRAA